MGPLLLLVSAALLSLHTAAAAASAAAAPASAAAASSHSPRSGDSFTAWLASKERLPLKLADYRPIARAYEPLPKERDLVPLLLNELLDRLQEEGEARDAAAADASEKTTQFRKRNSLWEPLRGPLPVETRFANFGSRLEPDGRQDVGQALKAMKAMRYGRR